MKTRNVPIFGLVVCLLGQVIGHGEDVNLKGWRFTAYVWLPSVDIVSTVDGTSVPIDLSLGDALSNFDVFGLSARGEYWWGQWGMVVDGIWTDLDSKVFEEFPIPLIDDLFVDIQDGILDVEGAYRFAVGKTGSMRLMAGLRYHYMKQEITITTPGPVEILGGSRDFTELLLGVQWVQPLSKNWAVTARADFSGFGIGSGSDLTASVLAAFGYDISEHWGVKFGYRYYRIDYVDGSGDDAFGQEGNMHGLWLGVTYQR
jgi:hypothetical protein